MEENGVGGRRLVGKSESENEKKIIPVSKRE